MSIQALSSGGCYVPSTPRAEKFNQRPQESRADECAKHDDDGSRSHRRGGGMSALFDALADELRAIAQPAATPQPASTAPATTDAPAATDPTATDATPATDPKPAKPIDLRDALKGFAEALFDGLRDVASEGRDAGGCGHHGRGHGWGRGGMSRLADRIEALAQKLAAAATPAAPKTEPAPAAPVAASETPATPATTEPAATTTTTTTATTATTTDTVQADKAKAVATAAPSGLEASFATLWHALNPDRLQEQGGLSDLLAFLHRLADRLDGERSGGDGSTGLLVDTVA